MVKVRDMMPGIVWVMSLKAGRQRAHMAYTRVREDDTARAYCGVSYPTWSRASILDYDVCKTCIKSSEEWAKAKAIVENMGDA